MYLVLREKYALLEKINRKKRKNVQNRLMCAQERHIDLKIKYQYSIIQHKFTEFAKSLSPGESSRKITPLYLTFLIILFCS
jgi:hypothetical protein